MNRLDEIADDYVNHARSDYVGLWQIASRVREELDCHENKDVRTATLAVVRRLLDRGLRAGDYRRAGFHFWTESNAEVVIARIGSKWEPARGDPTLAEPICWFAI